MSDVLAAPVVTGASFTVDAYEMRQALATIKPAVSAKGAMPVLSGVKVTCGDNGIRVAATNLELTIGLSVGGDVHCHGEMVVPFALFSGFVGKATARKSGPLTVSVDPSPGGDVSMVMGNRRRDMPALPVGEYPKMLVGAIDGVSVLDTRLIGDVLGAVSTDDVRPVIASVAVGGGYVVATDSYRLHLVDGPVLVPDGSEAGKYGDGGPVVLIPRVAAKEIVKAGGTAVMWWAEREATFEWEDRGLTITTRLVDGQYPRWPGLVPAPNVGATWQFTDRDAVVEALGVIKAFQVSDNTPVVVSAGAGGIELTIGERGVGSEQVTVPGVFVGDGGEPPFTVRFNPEYLLDAVKGLEGDGFVLETKDHLKPAVMREACELGERLRLIMPVRQT